MATTEPHATGVRADDLQPLLEWMRMIAAEALVDAFGIPDEVLRAPIAVR